MEANSPRFVTAADLVELYPGLFSSKAHVYKLVGAGVVPALRLGRQVRFSVERVERWIADGGAALPAGWRREPETPDAKAARLAARKAKQPSSATTKATKPTKPTKPTTRKPRRAAGAKR